MFNSSGTDKNETMDGSSYNSLSSNDNDISRFDINDQRYSDQNQQGKSKVFIHLWVMAEFLRIWPEFILFMKWNICMTQLRYFDSTLVHHIWMKDFFLNVLRKILFTFLKSETFESVIVSIIWNAIPSNLDKIVLWARNFISNTKWLIQTSSHFKLNEHKENISYLKILEYSIVQNKICFRILAKINIQVS